MLLAPVIRTTPLFRPYRFRIYLACIIVYFDLELQTMGSVSCLDPSAFLLASPQSLNPSMPSLAAAGILSQAQYPISPPLCPKKGKRKLCNILQVEGELLSGKQKQERQERENTGSAQDLHPNFPMRRYNVNYIRLEQDLADQLSSIQTS